MFKLLLAGSLISLVNAHGYLSQPAATYISQSTKTSYIARVDGNSIFPGLKWNDNPTNNANQLSKKNLPELRTFFSNYISGCPANDLNTVVSVDNLSSLKWQNDQEQMGFIPSHEGPCEAWIDSIKVFDDTNCAYNYKAYPADIPIDYSKCSGNCTLTFYWLAIHEPMWQMYKACVKITRAPKVVECIDDRSYSSYSVADKSNQEYQQMNTQTTPQVGVCILGCA
jgi:hypothetical protein